jgi:digeranylgeranylglycerophospholipid reductase
MREDMHPAESCHCDVLVVGAGPAGASAGRAAAERGLDVLMVDCKKEVGVPVRCAEYIPAPLIGDIDLGKDFIAQSIRGLKTFLPGNDIKETIAPGFIVDRDVFDQTLILAATAEGARLLCATRAISLADDRTVILKKSNGNRIAVKAKVIIGADGPRSTVGRWVGGVNRNLIPAVQARVALTRPMDHTEVYLDPIFHAGYGWLFPKNHEANIGIGVKRSSLNSTSIKTLLNRFLSRLATTGKVDETVLAYTAGWIPAEPVRNAVYGNVLLVGDAAGQTHPITGAGIFAAVTAGKAAGKWAAKAIRQNNTGLLKGYDTEWQGLMAKTLSHAYRRRCIMEENWHDFENIIKSCWIAYREYYAES